MNYCLGFFIRMIFMMPKIIAAPQIIVPKVRSSSARGQCLILKRKPANRDKNPAKKIIRGQRKKYSAFMYIFLQK
jgi:hypothetical protein